MSDPVRYDPVDDSGRSYGSMEKTPHGDFVRWEDYERLRGGAMCSSCKFSMIGVPDGALFCSRLHGIYCEQLGNCCGKWERAMASDIVDRLRDRADHMELCSPEQMELSDAVAEVLHLRADVERLQRSVDMLRSEAQEWRDQVLPVREENTRLRQLLREVLDNHDAVDTMTLEWERRAEAALDEGGGQ